ncbi:hypothetical protein [Azospirillum sp. B510]|nr:hypothetical protein [Azospirillum sp. B510]
MTDTLSTFAGTIWEWLNAEQNAGAVSALEQAAGPDDRPTLAEARAAI